MLLDQLAGLQESARADALLSIARVHEAFGRPHIHSGLGLRKLHSNIFECRAGLKLRVVFRDLKESLQFEFIGNHDEVDREWRKLAGKR